MLSSGVPVSSGSADGSAGGADGSATGGCDSDVEVDLDCDVEESPCCILACCSIHCFVSAKLLLFEQGTSKYG